MKSNRWFRFGCVLAGVLGLTVVACGLTGSAVWIVRQNPAVQQALSNPAVQQALINQVVF